MESMVGRQSKVPRISVIIPHLNQPHMLARCLASLTQGTYSADQIIVVDNGSDVLPKEVVAAHPQVILLQETAPGPGPARNKGVRAAQNDILAFIDADCIAHPDWLAEAQIALSDPSAMILGGDVRIALNNPAHLSMLEAYESIYAYRMDIYIAKQGFTGTGNLITRRAVWHDVGPFAGQNIAEDRDWGRRARAKGYKTQYIANMRVYHPARTDFSQLFAKWDRQLGHDYTLARSRGIKGHIFWMLKTTAMGLSPLWEVRRIWRSDRVNGPRSKMLAFCAMSLVRIYRMGRMFALMISRNPDRLSEKWNRG